MTGTKEVKVIGYAKVSCNSNHIFSDLESKLATISFRKKDGKSGYYFAANLLFL